MHHHLTPMKPLQRNGFLLSVVFFGLYPLYCGAAIHIVPGYHGYLKLQHGQEILGTIPLTLFSQLSLVYGDMRFNSETRGYTTFSQSGLLSIDPTYGYGYANTTITIDASSYLNTLAYDGTDTEFLAEFSLYSDSPFYLSIEATTHARGSASAFALVSYPTGTGVGEQAYSRSSPGSFSPSFSRSLYPYDAGIYSFSVLTAASDAANDNSQGNAGGFSDLSLRVTASTVVPEPATALFGVIGLAVLFGRRVRK